MTLHIIKSKSRGMADHGWLRSRHTFSFADYHNPHMMQFESLRVINEDIVSGGSGFPTHSHKDAEIFSYIIDGQLEHKDTLGNGSVVGAGGVQYMAAGTGVSHSEFNPDDENAVHFLQIWLLPNRTGAPPRYETLQLDDSLRRGRLQLFLSGDGRAGSMKMNQDVSIYSALLDGDETVKFEVTQGRSGWVQIVKGQAAINGHSLSAGDACALTDGALEITHGRGCEFILFDLAALH
ncbi:pirin family protein [Robiginitomaculum antarcticum]|uniref:pirin family protein n=1 Tax=Robiginitomaculum antarcticum TaxID=437507 RepID=UPI00037B3181|nr:pirin family protein [Robiginitomaculum antarcticum]